MGFKIVDDRFRDEDDESMAMTDALLRGDTVFISDVGNDHINTLYARYLNKYGRKLKRRSRTIDGENGFVVWLEGSAD